jgi:UPF0716 protein FxsA
MLTVKRAALFLLLLPATELVVFILVAVAIGFLNAVLLTIATSIAGILILRQAGSLSMQRVRSSVASGATITAGVNGAGFFTVLAGVLLFLPGFVTDAIGLALLVPWIRGALGAVIARAFVSSQRNTSPDIVDLAPDEWRRDPTGSLPRQRLGKSTEE